MRSPAGARGHGARGSGTGAPTTRAGQQHLCRPVGDARVARATAARGPPVSVRGGLRGARVRAHRADRLRTDRPIALSGRSDVDGSTPASDPSRRSPGTRSPPPTPETERPASAGLSQAAEGTRTLDLLHGSGQGRQPSRVTSLEVAVFCGPRVAGDCPRVHAGSPTRGAAPSGRSSTASGRRRPLGAPAGRLQPPPLPLGQDLATVVSSRVTMRTMARSWRRWRRDVDAFARMYE